MQNKSNMNHVSMSSIEPANNNNMQSQPKISNKQPSISKLNISNSIQKYQEYNEYGIQPIKLRRNSKRDEKTNQTQDSMVFLQQAAESNIPHTTTNAGNGQNFKLRIPLGEYSAIQDSLITQEKLDKRIMLKKNNFESDMGLQQTGRFEASPNPTVPDIQAKSANTEKLKNGINENSAESPEVNVQDFDRYGMQSPYGEESGNQENEMRETSYFKQQTDDEGSPQKQSSQEPTQSLGDLISISNQQHAQTVDYRNQDAAATMSLIQPDQSVVLSQAGETQLMSKNIDSSTNIGSNSNKGNNMPPKSVPIDGGMQMFKMSSRSQLKHRAQKNVKRGSEHNDSEKGTKSPNSQIVQRVNSKKKLNLNQINAEISEQNGDDFHRSISHQVGSVSQFHQPEQQLQIEDDSPISLGFGDSQLVDIPAIQKDDGDSSMAGESINDKQLIEIMKNKQQNIQNKNVNATGNFGALNIQKQQSTNAHHNYSALKGAIPSKGDVLENESESMTPTQKQMFTSMSDIGFPSNIHEDASKKNRAPKKGELITSDQIQRMMDTQNNWRVRTKTIDEMLHDIRDRIETDPEYIMVKSEQLIDFFLQLLTDQNFKIVLNTLNILNMILAMPQQLKRYIKVVKNEIPTGQTWGLSNATLGKNIPQIVKKLADSKNIIRQEAIKCLSFINEIMRSGNKKDNNFIALILPYLNNSSNWHIREELLHLLIKCFLKSKDQNEFDSYQILDSVLQLFSDTKEKIRNLSLEAIAAFSSIGEPQKINEILFQLNVEKEICELINTRLEYGMFPFINQDGVVEIPYQEQFQNYDVDSVAHSMANQSQVLSQYTHDQPRRKASIGGGSQGNYQVQKGRGNSSGRKIVVGTANATNQQLVVSQHDEIIKQAYLQSKRTASANNPNQYQYENVQQNEQQFTSEKGSAPYSYSVGGGTGANKLQRQQLLEELGIQQPDLNGSSFLPSLQKVYPDQQNGLYSSQTDNRGRMIGSSGGPGMGYIGGLAQGNIDPHFIVSSNQHAQVLISGGNKRSNKYLHGTPGQPSNYQAHFAQNGTNLQAQFTRGNSGKIPANHNMNNSISNKSPSLFDMSGNVASLFGNETKHGGNHFEQQMLRVQMSDLGSNERQEMLSSSGMNNSYFLQQTPSQMGHDQSMGYPPDAYFFGMQDVGEHTAFGAGSGGVIGGLNNIVVGPGIADQQQQFVHENRRHVSQNNKNTIASNSSNPNQNQADFQYPQGRTHQSSKNSRSSNRHHRELSNAQQQQLNMVPMSNKKNQNTFYSDGTTFTGITAATGATSQNKGMYQKQKIIMIKGAAHQANIHPKNQVLDDGNTDFTQHVVNAAGPGPIRATRAALARIDGSHDGDARQELCIDNRKIKSSSQNPTAKVKHLIKGSSQGTKQLKREESNDSDRLYEHNLVQQRSFSHSKNNSHTQSKEIHSAAAAPERKGYLGAEAIGEFNENGEDPAMLTQSSKIQYVQTEDLEPLEKPEKDYKKSIAKNQGIYSQDWADQFDACNVIRRVCKHHQSLILQTGNSLQGLVNTLVKLADSLRSAVTRIALMTLTDMFQTLKRVMEPCLVPIVKILVKRGSDTNHFIAEEADKCLTEMVQNCQESKVLQILQMQNLNSRSNTQRLKFCQCLCAIVKQLDNNILFFKENDKLLVQLAKYLQDASQDVRQQAKLAFVALSQAIMGQNDLEKLLQRVLNEVQYRKVKEFLDKEPSHLVAKEQIDFVITKANNQNQEPVKTVQRQNSNKQSFKSLRHNVHNIQKQQVAVNEQEGPLSVQAKSILNPSLVKQESQGFLSKVAQQNKNQKSELLQPDQMFIDGLKDIILRTQVNEWRLRLESSEQLFDLIRQNIELFNKSIKMVEVADAITKLLNDANAKIQISCLENFNKIFQHIFTYVEKYIHLFYKSIITNLGSSNLGVRKISEQILRQLNDQSLLADKTVLIQPLLSTIQYNSNIRLKPALIDQLIDLLDHIRTENTQLLIKQVLPLSYKLLDDNKNEMKTRVERLIRKLHSIPQIGQIVIDNCPQNKLQKVCDMCMKNTGSSGGGNGSTQIHLNSLTFKQ